MSIKKTLLAGAAVTMIAGTAMAAEPTKLTDAQMDDVSAGFLTLTGGLALVGPFDSVGFNNMQFTDLSQVATVEQVAITPTSVQQIQQTQSAAGLTSLVQSSGGALFLSGGTIAVGLSLNIP
jgi:hypothetical protein